jgi:hypothetical protein
MGTHEEQEFPLLIGDAINQGEQAIRDRVHQENKNIATRMKKLASDCLNLCEDFVK